MQAAWPLGPPLGQQQVSMPQAFCVGSGLPVSQLAAAAGVAAGSGARGPGRCRSRWSRTACRRRTGGRRPRRRRCRRGRRCWPPRVAHSLSGSVPARTGAQRAVGDAGLGQRAGGAQALAGGVAAEPVHAAAGRAVRAGIGRIAGGALRFRRPAAAGGHVTERSRSRSRRRTRSWPCRWWRSRSSRLPAQGSTGRRLADAAAGAAGRGVSVLPLQFVSPQAMPDGASAQLLMPLQAPVRPQALPASAAHSLSGSLPTGTARHWPSTPALFEATQAWQLPWQAVSQQTPSDAEAALARGRRVASVAVGQQRTGRVDGQRLGSHVDAAAARATRCRRCPRRCPTRRRRVLPLFRPLSRCRPCPPTGRPCRRLRWRRRRWSPLRRRSSRPGCRSCRPTSSARPTSAMAASRRATEISYN